MGPLQAQALARHHANTSDPPGSSGSGSGSGSGSTSGSSMVSGSSSRDKEEEERDAERVKEIVSDPELSGA